MAKQHIAMQLLLALAASASAQTVDLVPEDPCAGAFDPRSGFEAKADFAQESIPQIQAHLASVIARLESRDVAHLTRRAQASRREQIANLSEYSAAGLFPRNWTLPHPAPIFIDDQGRACAVGHLMIESGSTALAAQIRAEQNTAYIGEIRVPGTADWMNLVGLSAEECALIQPSYGPCGQNGASIATGSTCTPTTQNSGGHMATLTACGSVVATDNNFLLLVGGLPEGSVGYFLNARSADAMSMPGSSQGTICLSGSVGRHDEDIFAAMAPAIGGPTLGPGWWSGIGVDLTQMPTPTGAASVLPGDTWYFQAWYRDVNPNLTSNLSDVIWVTFI